MSGEEEGFGLLTELLGSDAARDLAPYSLDQVLGMGPEELIRSGLAAESARLLRLVGRLAKFYARALTEAKSDLDIDDLVTDIRRVGIAVYYLDDHE
jgi:hypothetical protein